MSGVKAFRVICEDGATRRVEVRPLREGLGRGFVAHPAGEGGLGGVGMTEKAAVYHLAALREWPIVDALAPGDMEHSEFAEAHNRTVTRLEVAEAEGARLRAEGARLRAEVARLTTRATELEAALNAAMRERGCPGDEGSAA